MIIFEKFHQVKEIIRQLRQLVVWDYNYFQKYYKIIAINLSKQQALDADPKAIHQINFIENLDREGNTTIFFIIEEVKETILDFSQGTVKVLKFYFVLI